MSIAANTVVSHYRIIEETGSGGIGEVYLAEDTTLNRPVLLKFLPAQSTTDEDAKLQFIRAAQSVAALSHPNLIRIYEVSEYQGRPFSVMESASGRTLRDVIHDDKLTTAQALNVAIRICEGLSDAHEAGLAHGNITPASILIDKTGQVKLIDFGLAGLEDQKKLSQTGTSISYLAPERIEGKPANPQSDIFSVGVVLHETLTAHRPSGTDSETESLQASDDLQRIIKKALDRNRRTRYLHVNDILADLRHERDELDSRRDFVHTLMNTANSLIVCLDKQARITAFNTECEKVTGYKREEVIGKSWPAIFLPEDHHHHRLKDFAEWVRQHPEDTYEGPLKTKSGQIRTILWSNSAVFSRDSNELTAITVGQDITEHKLAEERLKESEEWFRTVIAASKDAMVAIDREGLITLFNPSAEKMFGYKMDDVIGQPLDCLIPEEYRERHREYVRGYFTSGEPDGAVGRTIELPALRSSGEVFPIELSLSADRNGVQPFVLAVMREITERKRADERLRLFSQAVDSSIDGIAMGDLENRITYVNEAFVKMFGYSKTELIGKEIASIYSPDQIPGLEDALKATKLGSWTGELVGQRKNGELFPVAISSSMVVDTTGKLVAHMASQQDITQRKLAATRADARLRLLNNLRTCRDVDACLEAGCKAIYEAELFKRAVLTLHNDRREIINIGQVGLDESVVEAARNAQAPDKELSRNMTQEKFRISHSYFIPGEACLSVQETPRYVPQTDRTGTTDSSWKTTDELFVPIIGDDNVYEGWLSVDTPFSGQRPTMETVMFLEETVDIVTQKMREIRTLEKLRQGYKTLQESEEKFRLAFENAKDAIFWTNPETGLIINCNRAAKTLLEKKKHEIIGLPQTTLYPPEKMESSARAFREHVEQKRTVDAETEVITKSGKVKPVHMTASMTTVGGTPVTQGIFRDITDRKRAQEALRKAHDESEKRVEERTGELAATNKKLQEEIEERKRAEIALRDSEMRFRGIFENTTIGIYQTTPDGRILMSNPALAHILGYSSCEELAKRNLEEERYEPAYERSTFKKRIENEGQIIGLESAWARDNGTTLYVRESARAVRDDAGNTLYYEGTVEDITERKQAEQRIRESEHEKEVILDGLVEHVVYQDTTMKILWANQAACESLGLTREEIIGHYCYNLRQQTDEPCPDCPVVKAIETAQPQSIERQTPNGRVWFMRGYPVRDTSGDIVAGIELTLDITDQKRAEEALRKATDELKIEHEALSEKNIALKQILEHIERERQDYKQRICLDVEQAFTPVMRRLKSKASSTDSREYETLEINLKSLLTKDIDVFQDRYGKLTPRELEVCELIKIGMSSKEISDGLNLSLHTVHKHREKIRKKLGITNKSVNLSTYLTSH